MMESNQILLMVLGVLITIINFLTSGIVILVWNKITTETKGRKDATDALWEKYNGDNVLIHKNTNNIIKIASSLDIEIDP